MTLIAAKGEVHGWRHAPKHRMKLARAQMELDRIDNTGYAREQTPRSTNLWNPSGRSAKPCPLVVDFCCGMGGLSLAARQLGMTVLAGIDTDSDSLKTFSRNFPEAVAIEATVSGKKAVENCNTAINSHSDSDAP